MFRKSLEYKLKKIFGFAKVTYLAPSEMFEQDTLFIDILSAKSRLARVDGESGGRETCRVEGVLTVYSQDDRHPFGTLAKAVERADRSITAGLFFYDMDTDVPNSPARLQNISERRTSFIYLYDAQYDPKAGALTELEFQN